MIRAMKTVGSLVTGVLIATSAALSSGGLAACGTHGTGLLGGPENGGGDDGGGSSSGGASSGGGPSFASTGDDGGDDGSAPSVTSSTTPQSIDACSTGSAATSAQAQALQKGGSAGSLRFLYPYDGTLFPRGLLPPTIMWDGGSADVLYVHIKSALFEYKGCVKPTADGQFVLPASVWSAAEAHTQSGADPFALELTILKGSTVTGPVKETIFIAPATLKGTIYYNSYSSKLVGALASGSTPGFGVGSGAVLRIQPGKSADVFLGNQGCTGCHAVSANGQRMVADAIIGLQGETFKLTPTTGPDPMPTITAAPGPTFVGLTPDGLLYVANGHPSGMGPRYAAIAGGLASATLFETDTGTQIDGTGIPAGAMCPTFSPDGKQLVFNDYAIGNGHGLATMAFDETARKATNYKSVYQESDTGVFPGWPFFLPDE
jgi:hypothetical protein